jgi:hypothetical protein
LSLYLWRSPGAGAPKASLEACKAREALELVAQGVGVLVLAAQKVEAGAAGGDDVDEYVGEGPDAGGFPGERALFPRYVHDGQAVGVGPADLAVEVPEGGEVVDAVLLLEGLYSLLGPADAGLPDLRRRQAGLALVLGPLPDLLQTVEYLAPSEALRST